MFIDITAESHSIKLKDISHKAHKAVQADGVTKLKVLGEIKTTFHRADCELNFEALVVDTMGIHIIGGTDFHIHNDISTRMATDSINIGRKKVIQSSSPTELEIDRLETKARLISSTKKRHILPGEKVEFDTPPGLASDGYIYVEPYTHQISAFFEPKIMLVENNKFSIENETKEVITMKKGTQILKVSNTIETEGLEEKNQQIPNQVPKQIPQTDVTKQVEIDTSQEIAQCDKMPLIQSIKEFREVFQNDLPGYNGSNGDIFASFEFNSSTRPHDQKVRTPGYGSQGERLYNEKCLEMINKGVLFDPLKLGIQPSLVNNSWVIKKASSAKKSWEECQSKDVRLVTGFDYLNKFLKAVPSKVQKFEQIYTSISQWKYIGELDFSDMYWQMKFNLNKPTEREKVSYLCIRTTYGTMAYSRAGMGLLGMDSYQEELTDRLFGDLVVENRLVKVADNLYFGSNE